MNQPSDSLPQVSWQSIALATSFAALFWGVRRTITASTDAQFRLYAPGPPRRFLLGNLLDFPKEKIGDTFSEWARKYGDLVYVDIAGMPMLIVNTYELAQELLSKRANINSDRKVGYMALHLMETEWNLAFIQPGAKHQFMRKMLRRGIGPQRIASHDHLIQDRVSELMVSLLKLKGAPGPTLASTLGSIVISLTYGEEMWNDFGKELVDWDNEIMGNISVAFSKFWMVDVFNFLRFIPSWMPGAYFKKMGIRTAHLNRLVRAKPYARVLELYESGKLGHCLAADLLDEFGPSEELQDTLAALYLAGSETTINLLVSFIHAMFLHPHVADKVYAEIEQVTGGVQPLQIGDKEKLPYTEAVYKEALRWRPVAPVGLPHVSNKEDTINGYYIPQGTMISQNFGFMLSDPRVWKDPENFRPERFLEDHDPPLPHPASILFGFGMRVCPGIYLAERVGFHIAASIVSLFKILPLEDQTVPRPEDVEYIKNAFVLPRDFQCRFQPRNHSSKEILGLMEINQLAKSE